MDSFVSDPADPVPYRDRALITPFMAEGSTWSSWIADDQAPFTRRKDVLFWQSDVLAEDITVSGDIVAKLFASTSGSDADWVVKLVDIYPSDASVPAELRGRQRMIANDVFRGRFRTSYERPRAITPNAVLDYRIDLHSASHRFSKGHRIGVQVQSSWFPLIGRNPQTYVPNILRAKPGDFRKQTHRIYHRPGQASAIAVSVAN
jgi:putative CocE/NonD family hydrolase